MRSLTEQLYVDEVDVDEEGIAETLMDNNAIANVSRPGTGSGTISPGIR
jgi:tetratricopeptide repeat protein 8